MTNTYATQLELLHQAMVRNQCDSMLSAITPTRADQFSPEARLAVYVDGYSERLMGAVAADFSALSHYVGGETFLAMMRDYISETPSKKWDLNLYPIGFGAFVHRNTNDPALRNLAALEAAIVEVFWAPDSNPLDPSWLATLPQEKLSEQVFTPRKAHRLLSLEAQAEAYLASYRLGDAPKEMKLAPQTLCLVRHRNEVQRLVLDEAESALLAALFQGLPFGQALEDTAALPQMDVDALFTHLPDYMSRWLAHGVFGVQR